MKEHWDHKYNSPKTDFGKVRIIQRAWRRFQEKELSNVRLAWNKEIFRFNSAKIKKPKLPRSIKNTS